MTVRSSPARYEFFAGFSEEFFGKKILKFFTTLTDLLNLIKFIVTKINENTVLRMYNFYKHSIDSPTE